MSAPITPPRAVRFYKVTRDMLEDPDMTGKLLAYGMALMYEVEQRHAEGRPAELRLADKARSPWKAAYESSFGPEQWWASAKRIIADDAPRYDMRVHNDRNAGIQCQGTMQRRSGPCGQKARSYTTVVDPETGQRAWSGYCRNPAHEAEWERQHTAARDAWIRNGSPQPAANRGGILPRYFICNWDSVYNRATDGRYLNPETSLEYRPTSWAQPTPPRARLYALPPLPKDDK